MKHLGIASAAALAALLLPAACAPMSAHVHDPAAGWNGGFEEVRSGLPVNWIVYAPATIPSGRYELHFDRDDRREGAQALRFDVEECSSAGGRRSPGLCREIPVEPGATYAVGFWLKSEGCDWAARVGGVDAKTSRYESIDGSTAPAGEWTRVEHVITVPAAYDRLRFELSVRSPGRLWVDDVRVERADTRG